jgi:hypothetical protein
MPFHLGEVTSPAIDARFLRTKGGKSDKDHSNDDKPRVARGAQGEATTRGVAICLNKKGCSLATRVPFKEGIESARVASRGRAAQLDLFWTSCGGLGPQPAALHPHCYLG